MAAKWIDSILGKDGTPEEKAPAGKVARAKKTADADTGLTPITETTETTLAPIAPDTAKATRTHDVKDYMILEAPIITEKAVIAREHNQYVFTVARSANKIAIKKAFFNLFGVMPTQVRTLTERGNWIRGRYGYGKTKKTKKAIVTLPKGAQISQ